MDLNKKEGDYQTLWEGALKQLRSELSEQEFHIWFQQIRYLHSNVHSITISVPSNFYRDQIYHRYLPQIEKYLKEISETDISVNFEIEKASTPSKKRNSKTEAPITDVSHREIVKNTGLNPEYTFENFVMGDNNRFAANAAIAVSHNPGMVYNPCLIYGRVGLGKTHLLQAIGNYILTHAGEKKNKIIYITAENFINGFIQSIQENKTHLFKNKYRTANVLLIDDIHFLQKKHETQEELFHTFNALFELRKQMVFTCDRPISDIKDITERLQNRFTRGLSVDLQPPKTETAIAILQNKSNRLSVNVPEEVITYICQSITTNVRDLEAALTQVVAYSDLINQPISLAIAKQQVSEFFHIPNQKSISIDEIQRAVAEYFNVTISDLKGKRKNKKIILPRQTAMYISYDITETSMTDIGLEFGGRDHTTVVHACQRIKAHIHSDPSYEVIIQNIRKLLNKKS